MIEAEDAVKLVLPKNYAELPIETRRHLYHLVNDSHDSGAACMKAWILGMFKKIQPDFQVGGVAHNIDENRTAGARLVMETLVAILEGENVGMHDHEQFEEFDAVLQTKDSHSRVPVSLSVRAEAAPKPFITRPIKDTQ